MKKWISFFTLFVLLIVLCFGGYMYMARAQFLSNALSTALDTPVTVRHIDFSSDGLLIKEIVIKNPPGCELKDALSIARVQVKTNWGALIKGVLGLSSDKIIIDQLRIDKPEMTFELFNVTGSDNNWSRILEKVTEESSHKKSRGEKKSKKPSKSVEFAINKLLLTDVTLEMKHHSLGKASFKPALIERIEVRDIGQDNGVALQDICVEVTTILMKEAAKQFSLNQMSPEQILKDYFAPPEENLNKVQNILQDFLQKN